MPHISIWTKILLVSLAGAAPGFASMLTITPTFDPTITQDPNAAAIEATINAAIGVYQSLFGNPINVAIDFHEMSNGLGQSLKALDFVPYSGANSFFSAYQANAPLNHVAATAISSGVVPNTVNNPVTGINQIAATTAELRALNVGGGPYPGAFAGGYDAIIGLNTSLTTPGSPGSNLNFSLLATTEHEIDEVLGLGSSLNLSIQSDPSPEDLFRYFGAGLGAGLCSGRSYTTTSSAKAFFSYNGTTCLAQFDNQNDGGDWADWQSNPLPAGVKAQVQDAFGSPFTSPTLGSNEIAALEAIGYDALAPEPATATMIGLALAAGGLLGRHLRKSG